MNKLGSLLLISSLSMVSVYAEEMHLEEHASENNFYVSTKAIYSLGASVEEEAVTLKGSSGGGLGIDVGYKLGAGFSVELDVAYVEANIVEKDKITLEERTVKGSFTTSSLDVAYIHHVTHELEAFIKGGYEYEFEKINDLDVDTTNSGLVYAVGIEYELNHTSAIALEYEGTTIKGPRGSIASLGYVYSF
ncbi:outer membrane beta-barrel protein [Sulfurimonas sp. SAG-AH-194-C20]|nr:outer membrane beta-barrel protein [Sulfurimonas sp. SAG-AH-194-C20]MDF1878317.1 outer membrane beta-barrel protein [Sulfurimonas sp. SAG-AH-194-C20]